MRKEENNKTNDSLVEKDMVLNKGKVWENGEIVYRKEGLKMFFFLCFCCVFNDINVEDMRTMIWKRYHIYRQI